LRHSHRPWLGLRDRQHPWHGHEAHTLVANPTQLATAIVAIGLGCHRIDSGVLHFMPWLNLMAFMCVVPLVHQAFHRPSHLCGYGLMAVVRSLRKRGLTGTDRGLGVVRHAKGRALCHGHPDARPQPQRHEAQQEAKEQSAHRQIISEALARAALGPTNPSAQRGSNPHAPEGAQPHPRGAIKRSETGPLRFGWIRRCVTTPSPTP